MFGRGKWHHYLYPKKLSVLSTLSVPASLSLNDDTVITRWFHFPQWIIYMLNWKRQEYSYTKDLFPFINVNNLPFYQKYDTKLAQFEACQRLR